mmetsp:Transcript_17865/g.53790  ORF Transcript_17865/g.53790 Transcript_17865/m.53790 type:complete len:86 (+) Transcript_17865:261-518(+)
MQVQLQHTAPHACKFADSQRSSLWLRSGCSGADMPRFSALMWLGLIAALFARSEAPVAAIRVLTHISHHVAEQLPASSTELAGYQ